jgi:hypothetical protein
MEKLLASLDGRLASERLAFKERNIGFIENVD